jgi:microcystin-dependent protein
MECYVGEIIMFGGNYIPDGFLECNGSLQNIANYQALYSLIGTTYGGNGTITFAVPNLKGVIPIGFNATNIPLGLATGTPAVTLAQTQMPQHTHAIMGSTGQANQTTISTGVVLASTPSNILPYGDLNKPIRDTRPLSPKALAVTGGNQSHSNVMPTAAIKYMICWAGIYPNFN